MPGRIDTSDNNDGRKQSAMEVYEFWDGDDRKSFLWERPSHVLYLWQLSYSYKILSTVRQQLCSDSTMDGSSAPDVRQVRKRKSSPRTFNKLLLLLTDWLALQNKVNTHKKGKCCMPVIRSWRIQSRIWKDPLWSWK